MLQLSASETIVNNIFKILCSQGLFLLFSIVVFSKLNDKNSISQDTEKRIDGVLGIRNLGNRMEGIDESTELWRLILKKKYTDE